MKDFVLRDLTEREREKLNSFIANETTELYQYFMAIITTDLIPEGEVSVEKALEKVADEESNDDLREDPYSVCGLIDAWIRLCMEYKNYGLVDELDRSQIRGLHHNIMVAIGGFVNSIWYDVSIGGMGKKQAELEENYTRIVLNGLPKWSDEPIVADPERMYRFVMSALENLGFHLIVKSDNSRKIDLEMYRGIEF